MKERPPVFEGRKVNNLLDVLMGGSAVSAADSSTSFRNVRICDQRYPLFIAFTSPPLPRLYNLRISLFSSESRFNRD